MLNRYSPYSKKYNQTKIYKSIQTSDITGSLSVIIQPSDKKYITGTKKSIFTTEVVNKESIKNNDVTGSLENVLEPSDKKYTTGIKTNPVGILIVNTDVIGSDFDNEILEYSARYIKVNATKFIPEENIIVIENTLLDYGTEGINPENFEVIINGLHSPQIYTVKQDANNVLIQFRERLFSYDGLEKENVIVIGKLLEIGLEIESDEVGLTDENGEPLIL